MTIDRITVVYLVLAFATILSWFLGTEEAVSHEALVGSIVVVIAFVKLRLVGIHFMEIGRAPTPLRVVFETYVFGVLAVVLGLFLFI
jgi:hypothetical protein